MFPCSIATRAKADLLCSAQRLATSLATAQRLADTVEDMVATRADMEEDSVVDVKVDRLATPAADMATCLVC